MAATQWFSVFGWQEAMTMQRSVRSRRYRPLVAAALLGGLALAVGCGPTAGGSPGGAAKSARPGGAAGAQELVLGQPSQEEQEITRWGTTGKFLITPQRVVEGKPEDLQGLGEDGKFAGQKVAWVYVEARHVGGEPVKGPMVMTNIGAETTDGIKATRLLVFGDLSSRPADCTDEDLESVFKEGESRSMCAPYLIPAGAKVGKVTYSQGYYKDPLAWQVP
ncbi:hypothetical protein ACFWP3_18805 [Streptomyces sp. NPDC058525]|uniref:hypothetical protein n=1 Tax=Streptomyces sp. NPDC058525 TaxID=3346538 RepID=UPI003651D0EC